MVLLKIFNIHEFKRETKMEVPYSQILQNRGPCLILITRTFNNFNMGAKTDDFGHKNEWIIESYL